WGTARGRATARVRAVPPAARPWLAMLAPVMSASALALWMALTSLRLAHDRPLPREIVEYGERPGGAVVLVVLIAGVAPLVEEFVFRGWIQRPLERRTGPGWAIGVTAVLFALAHFEPGGIAIRVAGGIALGYAVWATRSIWAGVALHVGWNAGVLLFGGTFPKFDPAARGPWLAAPAAAAFLACAAVFTWIAPRLRAAGARSKRTE
ncbi:MAG TPA: CPBP family intramembrane glutamic endopeptidase, partial [Longimicrobium sp.]